MNLNFYHSYTHQQGNRPVNVQTQMAQPIRPTQTVASGLLQRQCACGKHTSAGGECEECKKKKNMLQRKLTIGATNDPLELEADRVATQVLSAPAHFSMGGAPPKIQRFTGQASGQAMTAPASVDRVLASPGRPLDAGLQRDMGQRFGHDFSTVRVHSDVAAAQSARDMNAHAYTVGKNVVFGAGRFAPGTQEGRRLIAHELTHVVQQRSLSPKTPNSSLQRQAQGQPGSSQYSEHVDAGSISKSEEGIVKGSVRREERTAAGSLFHVGRAPVQYDETNCTVSVPMKVAFRHATLADIQNCPPALDQPPPSSLPANVDTTAFRRLANEYVNSLNQDLNGWYSVRFTGCKNNRCHGQNMAIQVQVSEVSVGAHPDYEVAIVNLSGRSCVDDSNYSDRTGHPGKVLLYAQGLERRTMAHEGGHMVLGHGDEYRETQQPGAGRPEDRVRTDWTLMGSHHSYGRFSLLHQRHFAFIPAFLNRVRPGCSASLVEENRPPQTDLTFEFGIGYASIASRGGQTAGGFVGLGLNLGIPLSRQREWELLIGVHGRLLGGLDPNQRQAWLLGARLGLEHTFSPGSGGFTVGGGGEIGAMHVPENRTLGTSSRSSPYAEGGGYLGYITSPESGVRAAFRLEGAIGTEVPATGTIGSPGMSIPSDPESLRYFRLGLSVGIRF